MSTFALSVPSLTPLSFFFFCVTLLVDFCSSFPLPLSTNDFWALCNHRWCSRQPLAAGLWLNKGREEKKAECCSDRLPAITPLKRRSDAPHHRKCPYLHITSPPCCMHILMCTLQPDSQREHRYHILSFKVFLFLLFSTPVSYHPTFVCAQWLSG